MSRVIQMQGTLKERMDTQRTVIHGLHSRGGSTGATFLDRLDRCSSDYSWNNSDVILVNGEHKLYTMSPDEPGDGDWTPMNRECLLPKHVVVLEKPDTLLYHLERWLPKYNAELGMIMAYRGILYSVIGVLLALVIALVLGYEWWSVAIGLIVGASLFSYLLLGGEYWFRAFIAALRGAFFVWRRVLMRRRTRLEYKHLVEYLAQSYDRDVRSVHKILQHLI